jgi:hypothetical protein
MAGNSEERRPASEDVPDLSKPENRFERSDVDIRAISKFGIALALLCIASLFLVIGVFRFFKLREEALQVNPAIPSDARRLPPEPRLQSTPILDLKAVRTAEDQILHGYAWIDPDHGVVRIPIEKAMDLLAGRGLPARPGAAIQSAADGVTVPTDSGLGRKAQQPGGPLAAERIAPVAPAAAPAPAVREGAKH